MANLQEISVLMSSKVQRLEVRLPGNPTADDGSLVTVLYEVLPRIDAFGDSSPIEAIVAEGGGTSGGGDPDLDPDPRAQASRGAGSIEVSASAGGGTSGGGDPDLDLDPRA